MSYSPTHRMDTYRPREPLSTKENPQGSIRLPRLHARVITVSDGLLHGPQRHTRSFDVLTLAGKVQPKALSPDTYECMDKRSCRFVASCKYYLLNTWRMGAHPLTREIFGGRSRTCPRVFGRITFMPQGSSREGLGTRFPIYHPRTNDEQEPLEDRLRERTFTSLPSHLRFLGRGSS
jgi:hypothetical protein